MLRVVYAFGGPIRDKVADKLSVCHLNPPTIDILRIADDIVNNTLVEKGVYSNISQMPVVLIPVEFDRADLQQVDMYKYSIVLRPIITTDFMTGMPAIPGKHFPLDVLETICEEVRKKIPRISRVLFDLTSKPPGTIEWE